MNDVSLEDYHDLTGLDKDAYECQRCGTVFQEKFERFNCPACDTPDNVMALKERTNPLLPVDYGDGLTGYGNRTVRL